MYGFKQRQKKYSNSSLIITVVVRISYSTIFPAAERPIFSIIHFFLYRLKLHTHGLNYVQRKEVTFQLAIDFYITGM